MPVYYSGNYYLGTTEMQTNALYIRNYLGSSWTINAISALCGNMESESTINPGIWESLNEGNLSGGFGLVQWTPASKYLDWAAARGLTPGAMPSNLKRLGYEVEQNIQWGNDSRGNPPPFTFLEFTQSILSPYDLAIYFLRHYERPAVYDQPNRGTQAETWYNFLMGQPYEPIDPDPPTPGRRKKKGFKIWLLPLRGRRVF